MTVLDVGELDFEREVIERSRALPVVVDFWAEWCGPCRQLGPLLEQAAAEREGEVVLAKLDTDANQALAQAFGIQGIPAVKAFKDARVVDEFVGAQGREAVQRFFDGLLPSEADVLVDGGSEEDLRHALELQPGRPDAAVALARILIERGEHEEALELLEGVEGSLRADGLAARLRLRSQGLFPEALGALDDGDLEAGTGLLLDSLPAARDRAEEIRRVIVGELDTIDPQSPLASTTRRRLAAALY
ncbi:MAG TPA: thioredoxin domain-containing protein [Solirubrobacteraceae bacterium]|nr:thioredoxin domain-containing protein [Solirubrobacteraceae bacterium]